MGGWIMENRSASRYQVWFAALVFIAGMNFIILGKDFWQEKPFTQWNENEAMMLLSNSPWARPQSVKGDYGKVFVPHQIDTSSPLGAVRTPAMNPTQGYDENPVILYVRWHSSVKIRQAIGQLGLLRKVYTEEMAHQFISQEMPDIVISITGTMMAPFEKLTLEETQPKTFLLSKKDKNKKIPLKSVMASIETQDGSALYIFPRKLEGNPSVDSADDEIYFVTEVGKTKIRAIFKLATMMTAGKLDI
jgi:hypothetical protein